MGPDGVGSASFAWPFVVESITDQLIRHVEGSLRCPVVLMGLRFVDADGRDTTGPVPGGVVLVGFSTGPSDGPDHPTTLEDIP